MKHKFKFIFLVLLMIFLTRLDANDLTKSFKPRITIITSVYNGDEFIEGFLKDITEQTIFKECELIMIDANSPGNEEKIIKNYMIKYPNIIYVKLAQDPGIYDVWNLAIKMSSADFVSNANLDDRSDPQALEIQVKELEANPDIDLVYTGYLITRTPNETFFCNHAKVHCRPVEFSKNMRRCLPGPRPVWRKSVHDRYGLFDNSFTLGGDYEMWLRAVSLGAEFKMIPKITTLYYFNPKGISTDSDEKKVRQRALEKKRIIKYLRRPKV